jgi:hypothetical protein
MKKSEKPSEFLKLNHLFFNINFIDNWLHKNHEMPKTTLNSYISNTRNFPLKWEFALKDFFSKIGF